MSFTGFFIGEANEGKASALLGLPHRLHRRHFGGLMFEGIKTMKVARYYLQRDDNSRSVDTRLEHHFGRRAIHAFSDSVSTHASHQEGRGQQTCQHHVGKTIRERGIKNNRRPALCKELTLTDFKARGGMHP